MYQVIWPGDLQDILHTRIDDDDDDDDINNKL